jgi:hypothetical protein
MAEAPQLEEFWDSAPMGGGTFQIGQIAAVPDLARRYLQHAIAPGARLASAVRLRMHGYIKVKRWLPFKAEQVIRWDRGLIWRATARISGLPIRGSDRLVDGCGAMRWRLFDIIPVLTAAGPDITRSAAGRLIAESIWLPSVLCGGDVSWTVTRPSHLRARFTVQDEPTELDLAIDSAGRLESLRLSRWGNPEGGGFHYVDFGAVAEEEGTFGSFTIPTRMRAGWYFGSQRFESEGEFFRVTIDDAVYR